MAPDEAQRLATLAQQRNAETDEMRRIAAKLAAALTPSEAGTAAQLVDSGHTLFMYELHKSLQTRERE